MSTSLFPCATCHSGSGPCPCPEARLALPVSAQLPLISVTPTSRLPPHTPFPRGSPPSPDRNFPIPSPRPPPTRVWNATARIGRGLLAPLARGPQERGLGKMGEPRRPLGDWCGVQTGGPGSVSCYVPSFQRTQIPNPTPAPGARPRD